LNESPTTSAIPQRSHFGIYVRDIDAMTPFYADVFGSRLTDTGIGGTFKCQLNRADRQRSITSSCSPPDARLTRQAA